MNAENSPTFTSKFTHPTYSPNELIQTINQQTPVSINLVPEGYAWSWKCLESKTFATPQLALIDWINHVSQSYEEVLIELLEKDDPEDDGDGDLERDKETDCGMDVGEENIDD